MRAREDVLARVRLALGPSPAVTDVPRGYRTAGAAPPDVELLCARVADYCARAHRTTADEIAEAIARACRARGTTRLVAAPDAAWNVPGVEVVTDDPSTPPAALDGGPGALTGCALAIAETGTIVLDGNPLCGRRR